MTKSQETLSPSVSNFLNFIRWMAALLVVVTHIRTLLFIKIEDIENPSILTKIFYFFTNLGGEAVMVFFVLSGFLVGGKVYAKYSNYHFKWKVYFIKRISRLFVVLIPALIFGGLLDIIGVHFFNSSGTYINTMHLIPFNYNIEDRLNAITFLSNLFMMQTTLTPQFGSNGPLWSLANEFWYYLLFPLIIGIWYERKISTKIIFALIVFLLSIFLNLDILLYFPVWLVGVFAYYYRYIKISFILSVFLVYVSFLLDVGHYFPYQKIGSYVLSISIGLLIISINQKDFVLLKKVNHLFADFSYTLYLFHDPMLLFIFATFSLTPMMEVDIFSFLLFFILLLILYLYSIGMYYLFEKNTSKVRNILFRKFS